MDLWVSRCEKIVVVLPIPELRAESWETKCQDPGSLQRRKPDLHTKGRHVKWNAAVDSCSFHPARHRGTHRESKRRPPRKESEAGRATHGGRAPRGQLAHRAATLLRLAQSQPCVSAASFLPLLLEFHGCDISFLGEVDIQIGTRTQMLQSFSEMLHQHHRLAAGPSRGRGHV